MTSDANKPGRGYIYVEMRIGDPEGFRQYTALSAPAVRAAGGRYIVRGATPEVLEGSWDTPRIAIVEFDTREHARAFYDPRHIRPRGRSGFRRPSFVWRCWKVRRRVQA